MEEKDIPSFEEIEKWDEKTKNEVLLWASMDYAEASDIPEPPKILKDWVKSQTN
jgi:hypothetical protein